MKFFVIPSASKTPPSAAIRANGCAVSAARFDTPVSQRISGSGDFAATFAANFHGTRSNGIGRLLHRNRNQTIFTHHAISVLTISAESNSLNAAIAAAADRVLQRRDEIDFRVARAGVLRGQPKQGAGDRRIQRVERDHRIHRFQSHFDRQRRIVKCQSGDRITPFVAQRFDRLQRALPQ